MSSQSSQSSSTAQTASQANEQTASQAGTQVTAQANERRLLFLHDTLYLRSSTDTLTLYRHLSQRILSSSEEVQSSEHSQAVQQAQTSETSQTVQQAQTSETSQKNAQETAARSRASPLPWKLLCLLLSLSLLALLMKKGFR